DHTYNTHVSSDHIFKCVPPRLFLHSARVAITRYLRQPLNGRREYKLKITAPLPADFVSTCSRLGIPVDPTWTPDYTKATANGIDLSFKHEETREEDVIAVLK
ncbi:hypothetical protein FRC07_013572, partial [Ceratobasidium sp. 392]